MNKTKQTVAVIGGGVIGLNSAYQLQKQGFQVTVFDGNGMASDASASYGNAGHFATEQVFPLADAALLPQLPKMLLDPLGPFKIQPSYFASAIPWFMRFMSQMRRPARASNMAAIKMLNKHSVARWQTLVSEINAEHLLTLNGSLLTYEKKNEPQIAKDLIHYQQQGVAVESVKGQALKELAPWLDEKIVGALYFTQVGHTGDPGALCQFIAKQYQQLGGEVIEQQVVDIDSLEKPMIMTADSSQLFDKVIVCAGAHSKALVKKLGFNVPLEAERGYHLMLPIDTDINLPIASFDRKFIMTPMQGGLRLAGTVEFGGLENGPDHRRSDMMLTHAKAMLSQLKVPELADISLEQLSETARWMGFRPSLPDSLPVIDKSPVNAAVFFNFGHQHLGLTWGALSGELICDLVMGRQPSIDTAPYRITRF